MGVGNSVPLWLNPFGAPEENYDMFGFLPENLKRPPQYDWSQLYQEGVPSSANFTGAYLTGKDDYIAGDNVLWVASQIDRLQTWGSRPPADYPGAGNGFWDPAYEAYPTGQFPPGTKTWSTWVPDGNTCTPTTFPNCDMTSFAESQGGPRLQYADWWWGRPGFVNDGSPAVNDPSTAGAVLDKKTNAEHYVDAIDRMTVNYSQGLYQGLELTNTEDTSGYDPCATSGSLDMVIPPVLAFVGLGLFQKYGTGLTALLPNGTQWLADSTVFGTLFFFSQASLHLPGSEEFDSALGNSAAVLAIGAGAFVFSAGNQYAALNVPEGVALAAGGFFGVSQLSPVLYTVLLPGASVGGVLTALPQLFLGWIQRLICSWSIASFSACDDFGEANGGTDAGFPEARRWDIGSLATKLTDIACEQEGWARDSLEAQFVFRSLMMNPGWFNSATTIADDNLWKNDQTSINPLGLFVGLEEAGGSIYGGHNIFAPTRHWWQNWTKNAQSPDGATGTGSTNDPTTSENKYACQSFDLLYHGDECYNPARKPSSTNDPDAPPCADVASDWGEDQKLATNMKTWLQDAIANAYDFKNLSKMFNIPGLTSTLQPLDDPYNYDVFFKTCWEDFGDKFGYGFNDVNTRGRFALQYVNASTPLVPEDTPDFTEMIANTLFSSYPSLRAAWSALNVIWSEQALVAYAHWLYRILLSEFWRVSDVGLAIFFSLS